MNSLLDPRDSRALVLAIALSSTAVSTPRPAATDDFTDFRIPKNRALLWTGGLGTRASGRDTGVPGTEQSSGSMDASASTRLNWFSDSDPVFTSLGVDLSAAGGRLHTAQETRTIAPTSSFSGSNDRDEQLMVERWWLSGSHRRYPWAEPLGFEISASLFGDYAQQWSSTGAASLSQSPGNTTSTTSAAHSEIWRYDHAIAVAAAAGWGRVRNATGIYDALVLERRLIETGAITRPLSGPGRQRLAEALYMRGTINVVHERPGRVLWREIERVLAEDGALREDGLDPYSVLRAAEPHLGEVLSLTSDGVPISPVVRLTGGFVGLRLADSHINQLNRQDGGTSSETIVNGSSTTSATTFSSRSTRSEDFVEGGPAGEVHLPMGTHWQLDAFASVMLGLRAQENQMRFNSQAALYWLTADRWTANAKATYLWHDDLRTEGATGGDRWQLNLGTGVSWYLEDRTAIELAVSTMQFWRRGDPGVGPGMEFRHVFTRATEARLGITYRFAGWTETPGFFTVPAAIPPASP